MVYRKQTMQDEEVMSEGIRITVEEGCGQSASAASFAKLKDATVSRFGLVRSDAYGLQIKMLQAVTHHDEEEAVETERRNDDDDEHMPSFSVGLREPSKRNRDKITTHISWEISYKRPRLLYKRT